jgi:hypothetical protein
MLMLWRAVKIPAAAAITCVGLALDVVGAYTLVTAFPGHMAAIRTMRQLHEQEGVIPRRLSYRIPVWLAVHLGSSDPMATITYTIEEFRELAWGLFALIAGFGLQALAALLPPLLGL